MTKSDATVRSDRQRPLTIGEKSGEMIGGAVSVTALDGGPEFAP